MKSRRAELVDSPAYHKAKDIAINVFITSVVCGYVVWAYQRANPFLVGSGIAVTLGMIQYYLKWFIGIKK